MNLFALLLAHFQLTNNNPVFNSFPPIAICVLDKPLVLIIAPKTLTEIRWYINYVCHHRCFICCISGGLLGIL